MKVQIEDLAMWKGAKLFDPPISTSSLAKPSFDRFMNYSKTIFHEKRYTNNGSLNQLLEARLADFHGSRYCITTNSGFWALVIAIKALKLPGRTEIVIPSLTYRRMADVAAWAGLVPKFCDVDSNTLSPSARDIKESITPNTAIILGVHPIVNTCDTKALNDISRETGIPLLIDSVESVFETTSCGKVGSTAKAEVFSMHASKLLNGGEGGYITTNDLGLANELRMARAFGFERQDSILCENGMNTKLNEIHAAMALANLDELGELVEHNRQVYQLYDARLEGIEGLDLVRFDESYPTSFKNILVKITDEWPLSRENTLSILESEGVLARAYYGNPLHRKDMKYDFVPAELPNTDFCSTRYMLLPCGYKVSLDDVNHFCDFLLFIYKNAKQINAQILNKAPK